MPCLRGSPILHSPVIRYRITDGTFAADPDAWFQRLCTDVDFIQIREKHLSTRDLAELVRRVMQYTPVPVLVNDRIDVAIACGAAGVHLRAGSISPVKVKRLAPLMVTVAVHIEDDIRNAEGADYLILAPIFQPLSKPDPRPPLGLQTLQRLAKASTVPILALGGITPENARSCVDHGAAGIAGITLFTDCNP
jgi:thiamine-phosphate diphosphorylase